MVTATRIARLYYARAGEPLSARTIRMLGGNCSWTEVDSPEWKTKIRNLVASGHVVFASLSDDPTWNIDAAICEQTGAKYPAGFYEF